jgi:LPS sulfotransferase NodH
LSDLHPDARGYAICCEPRSGSVYLCQLLASTGVLGNPTEYFNADTLRARGVADYPADKEGQLAQIPRLGATPNGVYGVKVFSRDADAGKEVRWAERLPRLSTCSARRSRTCGRARPGNGRPIARPRASRATTSSSSAASWWR